MVPQLPCCHPVPTALPSPKQEEVPCAVGFRDRKQALVGLSPGLEEGRGGNADIAYHLLAPARQFPSKPSLAP